MTEDTRAYLYNICIDSLNINEYTILPGESLSVIFSKIGLDYAVGNSIMTTTATYLNPKKIRAGQSYFTFTARDESEAIQYLVFSKSLTDYVVIDLTCRPVQGYLYQKDVALRQRLLKGSVKSSLWNEIKKQGTDPVLAIKLADIFACQIDFFGIQENDSFQVLFTESFIDDSIYLNIVSIDGSVFTHAGKSYLAVPFTQDSVPEYFDAEGQSLQKAFLKAPLDFFRITSHFTNSRFHPVLKRYRSHHGVDYAAPSGTPVKTVGSGKVIGKGFQPGGGNFVKIQHNAVYATSYMHLSRFAGGMAAGKHVQQGEVIGYVGSTGLSTGPHLDFRVYKNGKPIDPLKMESPPSLPVRAELKDSFNLVKQKMLLKLNAMHLIDSAGYHKPDSFNLIRTNIIN
ncbi:MAG: M23 family metallopeptidase [Prevotellaceae bacterium]|jgi:murein DD-endopeptidase MepM/ murein hydrolase activator NlpD|nr:M23 family metallopeptidase [Prevotellaceae bacterium]